MRMVNILQKFRKSALTSRDMRALFRNIAEMRYFFNVNIEKRQQ